MPSRRSLLIISWFLAFLYCFPYLVSITTTNYYMLRKNNALMDAILGVYDTVEHTDLGTALYLPLFMVFFTTSDHTTKVVWTFVVFTLAILFFYWVLRFWVSIIMRKNNA